MPRENGERREKRVPQRNNASERNHVETGDSPVSRAKLGALVARDRISHSGKRPGVARPHTTHNYTGVAVFRGGL
jgi:hypothetical protein